jgi:uncharacterized protein YigE (DUF2233 family)
MPRVAKPPAVRRGVAIAGILWGALGWTRVDAQRPKSPAPLPPSTLAVKSPAGTWQTFWSATSAPTIWRDASLAPLVQWRAAASGVEWSDIALAGTGEAWRTRLIVARFSAATVSLYLDTAFTTAHAQDWSLERAPENALLAVNAGQFEVTMPWGWVVLNGHRWLSPQHGPLSAALAQDSNGTLFWLRGNEVAQFAAKRQGIRWAFQSYPVLLSRSVVPEPLRGRGRGIDVVHRDARVAICLDHTDRIIVAITRFDAIGQSLGFLPFGLTTPEMAGIMGALGCRDAMLLDGGISAQLRLRDAAGKIHDWSGARKVPLALIALPRVLVP